MIDSHTLDQLNKVPSTQWSCIFKELILYAELRLYKAGFAIRSEKDVVNGQDFATQAIEKVFDGTRKWDFNRHPDILIHLKLIVKSLIWNHIKASTRSVIRKFSAVGGTVTFDTLDDGDDAIDLETPETIFVTDENWNTLEKGFGEDQDGFIIFCDWLDGISSREIADNYNVEVAIVYNITKKGKRLLGKVLFN